MSPKCSFRILFLLFTFSASQSYAASNTSSGEPETIEYVVGLVNKHCGSCHDVPSPNLMPKKSWPTVIQAMADLSARRMGQEFISAEVARHITAYYYGTSPESLPLLPYYQNTNNSRTFLTSELGKKSEMPLVMSVMQVELGEDSSTEFLVCDGESNKVLLLAKTNGTWQETVLAEVQAPIRTEIVDYDLDGDEDIIVAALGRLPPSDELAGRVLILRQSDSGQFEKEVLLEGVGRVTDARAVDVDNDNDLDLVVAVFGGGAVGELAWLENIGEGKHAKHILLNLSGALNISPVDLDADGKTDFVSLISQEHEMVVAFMNRGEGRFDQVLLARAPHPMYGSTGMKLVDLDGDGDTDVLFTNGDAFDTQADPKPYHGVQWLENKGKLEFQFHDIGRFYGAATAVAGDLDADGDLDVVAGSWLNYWDDARRQSLIWFENDGKQKFTRQNILGKPPGIVSLALEDITGDGQLDIIAGVLRMDLLMNMIRNPGKEEDRNPANIGQEILETRVILLENRGVTIDFPEQP